MSSTRVPFFPLDFGRAPACAKRHAPVRRLALPAVALVSTIALLAAFAQVMGEAVRQGELRREATARHSTATWRCTAMHSLRLRDACLAELNAAPPQQTLVHALPQ